MPRTTIDHHTRTITTQPLPQTIHRARRRIPASPPIAPMDMWVLITETHRYDGSLDRFRAEPLFPGPVERTETAGLPQLSSTHAAGRLGHHPQTSEPAVIYQGVETKPSWQRHGVATELLLRLQGRFGIYGSPILEAPTPEGRLLARSMADSGWTTTDSL